MFLATLILGAGFGIKDKLSNLGNLPGFGIDVFSSRPGASSMKAVGITLNHEEGTLPVVVKVAAGSIAEKSGLKAGDTIKAINRITVKTQSSMNKALGIEDKRMHLLIERDGKPASSIVLGEEPKANAPAAKLPGATPELGLNVSDMIGMYPAGVRAPMAMQPAAGSLIDKAGIKAGEWIVAVNGKNISTAAEYRQLTEGEGPLTLTVLNTEQNPRQNREIKIR